MIQYLLKKNANMSIFAIFFYLSVLSIRLHQQQRRSPMEINAQHQFSKSEIKMNDERKTSSISNYLRGMVFW